MLPITRPRVAAVAALLVVAAALAAGCGSTSYAFKINGNQTSQSDFNRELDAFDDNEVFVEAYTSQLGTGISDSDGTITSGFAAEWMTLVIVQEILGDAADEENLEITPEIDEQALADSKALFAFGAPDGGEEIWNGFPEWFQDRVVERTAKQLVYLESQTVDVSEEEIEEAVQAEIVTATEACESGKFVSHILVDNEELATDLRSQLDAGASFSELVAEHSVDPGAAENGGYYDCYTAGTFVAEFEAGIEATATGEISAPVTSEFGVHIIKVDAQPSVEAVQALVEANLGQPDYDAVLVTLDEADVDVDSKYGTWESDPATQTFRVVPPDDGESDEEVPVDLEPVDPNDLEEINPEDLQIDPEDIQVEEIPAQPGQEGSAP